MHCSWCESVLDRYLEGTLPAPRMAAVGRHIERCTACADVLVELRVVDALLATTQPPELAENFTFAVMADVRSIPAPKRSGWHRTGILIAAYVVSAWIGAIALYPEISGWVTALAAPNGWLARTFAPLAHQAHAISVSPALLSMTAGGVALDVVTIAAIVWFVRTNRRGFAAIALFEDKA